MTTHEEEKAVTDGKTASEISISLMILSLKHQVLPVAAELVLNANNPLKCSSNISIYQISKITPKLACQLHYWLQFPTVSSAYPSGTWILTVFRKQTQKFNYEFCYGHAAKSQASDKTLSDFIRAEKKGYTHSPEQIWARYISSLPCLAFAWPHLKQAPAQAGPSPRCSVPHIQEYLYPSEVLHIRQGVRQSNICSRGSTQLCWLTWASCQSQWLKLE